MHSLLTKSVLPQATAAMQCFRDPSATLLSPVDAASHWTEYNFPVFPSSAVLAVDL